MKGKVYATKIYHYLWMTMLACDQLRAYFLSHNYVPVSYHKSRLSSWLTHLFSKFRGMFHPLGTAQNFNIQFVVSMPWNTIKTSITGTPMFWGHPAAPLLPILLICVRSLVKTRQSQSYKFKELAKSSNFSVLHTPEIVWQDVWIWNGSGEHCWRYRADTILSTDGLTNNWTDGQRDKKKPVYPPPPLPNFVVSGDIMIFKLFCH